MTAEAEIPTQFTHSVKISDTAKGIRIDVHVWANSMDEALIQAFRTYTGAREHAIRNDVPLAPMEINNQ